MTLRAFLRGAEGDSNGDALLRRECPEVPAIFHQQLHERLRQRSFASLARFGFSDLLAAQLAPRSLPRGRLLRGLAIFLDGVVPGQRHRGRVDDTLTLEKNTLRLR